VKEQETVDRLAKLAEPRLKGLLRLRSVRHVYDPTPGALNVIVQDHDQKINLNKFKKASQPYHDIDRFFSADKIMPYVVDPGLLPLVTALAKDIAGRKLLVTRRIAPKDGDKGVIGHLSEFGVRIMMYFDEQAAETIIEWDCLYGVL
jgi:hypothetical protein